ncbi:peptidoglycan-binding protein [Sulfobacillus sp. hq2]|uniref:peptidoglycan-binding protein n=1 Tax=Sulfobacillus TaxID=28033 RepID=UPI000CD21236|nr:peptidoglycan-binding protein [Sulfobacillus sp. hq2]POB11528.1 peptidoglycan-binding protein [Sulfobacillus sp. hq2]
MGLWKPFALAISAMSSMLMVSSPTWAQSVTLPELEAQHPAMQHTLSYSDQGHWVMTLQADLQDLGFSAVGPVDGIFGPKTEQGVKDFQQAEGLPVTGTVDPATWQDILAGFHLTPAYSSSEGSAVQASNASPQTIDGKPVVAVYHMTATAYGPSAQDNYPYGPVDAFGQPLQPGMIAVDPSVIPLKSTVYVQGYHDSVLPQSGFLGQAMDTGGAIVGDRIDIFMDNGSQTVANFGIQPVTVYVLGQ